MFKMDADSGFNFAWFSSLFHPPSLEMEAARAGLSTDRKKMAVLRTATDSGVAKKFDLKQGVVAMGRHPDCHVVIEDNSVSRFHAQISYDGEDYYLEDLDSRNGTYLNEAKVFRPALLQDGDIVRICDFSFVFKADDQPQQKTTASPDTKKDALSAENIRAIVDREKPEFSSNAVVWDDGQQSSDGSTIMSQVNIENAFDVDRATRVGPALKLKALMEVTRALSGTISLSKVGPKVLDCLLEMFQNADRCFIILKDAEDKLRPIATKSRSGAPDEQMRCSRTVFEHVIKTKQAVLSADTSSDSRFDTAASIVDIEIRSMMCAPLLNSDGDAMGMIQLDSVRKSVAFREEDLELLSVVAMQAATAIEKAHLIEVEMEQEQLKRDLQLANEVQVAILPHRKPDIAGFEFYDFYRSANQVGGDYFDYITLNDGRIAVVVADVVGHGVAAALLMAKFSTEVRFALMMHADLGEAVSSLNRSMTGLHLERFITMILCVIDPETGSVRAVNAGHNLPILTRADGSLELQEISLSGLPVGIMADVEYSEIEFQLHPGDCMALYTDGLNEQVDSKGIPYGNDRLRKEFCRFHGKSVEQIGKGVVADIRLHSEKVRQADDMCLVCFGPIVAKS